jgi:hypothetical protein
MIEEIKSRMQVYRISLEDALCQILLALMFHRTKMREHEFASITEHVNAKVAYEVALEQ